MDREGGESERVSFVLELVRADIAGWMGCPILDEHVQGSRIYAALGYKKLSGSNMRTLSIQ